MFQTSFVPLPSLAGIPSLRGAMRVELMMELKALGFVLSWLACAAASSLFLMVVLIIWRAWLASVSSKVRFSTVQVKVEIGGTKGIAKNVIEGEGPVLLGYKGFGS
jgi:hypothetical protein